MTEYVVNTNHLSIDAAAAILVALNRHYGEDCTERVLEIAEEIRSGREAIVVAEFRDDEYLCKCVERF